MKRLYTIIVAIVATVTASAQDVCFADEKGNTVVDGSVVVMNRTEVNDFDETIVPLTGLSIKNTTSKDLQVRLTVKVDEFAGCSFSCCVGTNCHYLSKAGNISIDNITIKAGSMAPITNTEWVVNPGQYGSLTTKFTLETQMGTAMTKQSELTVNFVYQDPANIEQIESSPFVTATFDLSGRRTSQGKGIIIEQMSDGSVRKGFRQIDR